MYELTTLDNGLRVLTVTLSHVQSASMGFFVGVGSRFEGETLAGASHFIEHMLFKGTQRRPTALHRGH
jgi:predicted Zn-dependent peptidase